MQIIELEKRRPSVSVAKTTLTWQRGKTSRGVNSDKKILIGGLVKPRPDDLGDEPRQNKQHGRGEGVTALNIAYDERAEERSFLQIYLGESRNNNPSQQA
ncbi:hypothetical protein MRX96_011761 [Rhipicephalus microplus]